MTFRSLIFAAAAISLVAVFGGCGGTSLPSIDADKFFPQKVGDFDRLYPPNFYQLHNTKYQRPGSEIYYGAGSFQTDSEAQKKFDDKKTCDFPDQMDTVPREVVTEAVLKDKSGKDVGKIRICRISKDFLNSVVGDYKHSIVFTNGSTFVSVAALQGTLADLTQFVGSLPFNSQIDLASDLGQTIAANSSKAMSAHDLMKLDVPVKLVSDPYIKGKMLIVRQTPSPKSTAEDDRLTASFVTASTYRLDKNDLAESYEGAQTIIRIACTKGPKMGDYISKDELKQKFPAYSSNCKLSVIDKTIPAIIAQKDFIGTDIPEETSFSPKDEEVRALEPLEKIEAFIKQLSKR